MSKPVIYFGNAADFIVKIRESLKYGEDLEEKINGFRMNEELGLLDCDDFFAEFYKDSFELTK